MKFTQFFAKGLALGQIADCGFIGRLGDAQRLGGNANSPRVQHRHGNFKALALFTQPMLSRADIILKHQFAGGTGANAHFWLNFATHKPRLVGFDQKRRDAIVPPLGRGHGKQQHKIGHRPAGHPTFAPVDDIAAIASLDSAAFHAAGIAAAARLGQRIGRNFLPTRHRLQKFLFEQFAAIFVNAAAIQRVIHTHNRAMRGIGLAHFLKRQHV